MSARVSNVLAGCGLALFGTVIGILTALSTTVGTVTALLGLLFALVGGSLAAVFGNKELTPEKRRGMMHAAGVVSVGILLGLFSGFGLKAWERSWPGVRAESPPTDGVAAEGQRSADFFVFRLHGALTTEQEALNRELGLALRNRPAARTDEDQKRIEKLASAVNGLVDSVRQVEDLIRRNPSAVSDDFKERFADAFPPPATQPSR